MNLNQGIIIPVSVFISRLLMKKMKTQNIKEAIINYISELDLDEFRPPTLQELENKESLNDMLTAINDYFIGDFGAEMGFGNYQIKRINRLQSYFIGKEYHLNSSRDYETISVENLFYRSCQDNLVINMFEDYKSKIYIGPMGVDINADDTEPNKL